MSNRIDPASDDPDTAALQELNLELGTDRRVDASLVPIGDGTAVALKR